MGSSKRHINKSVAVGWSGLKGLLFALKWHNWAFLHKPHEIIISNGINHLFCYSSVPSKWSLNKESSVCPCQVNVLVNGNWQLQFEMKLVFDFFHINVGASFHLPASVFLSQAWMFFLKMYLLFCFVSKEVLLEEADVQQQWSRNLIYRWTQTHTHTHI